MIDPVLAGRLDALDHNLGRIETGLAWLKQLTWVQWRQQYMPQDLADELERTIGQEVREAKRKVQEIHERLQKAQSNGRTPAKALQAAWRDYAAACHDSQTIFAECLEYIGGLALRDLRRNTSRRMAEIVEHDSGLEQQICEIADELIRKCAKSTRQDWKSLTIPAVQESLTKTMARIIRLRFPEWTIWTLPITAHEYGHVMSGDSLKDPGKKSERDPWDQPTSIEQAGLKRAESRRRFTKEEIRRLPSDPAPPPCTRPELCCRVDRIADVQRRARYHYEEFLADAFATYTMGPAYACSLVLLRFNPLTAYEQDDERPADARRAHLVFSMLRRMDREDPDGPYQWVIAQLDRYWQAMLNGAGPLGSLGEQDRTNLAKLVDEIWTVFDLALLPGARYPDSTKDGVEGSWRIAQQWADEWGQHIQTYGYPPVINAENISPTHTLRDALNAAWLCRLHHPGAVTAIAVTARALCDAIIEAQRKGASAPRSLNAPRTGTSYSRATG